MPSKRRNNGRGKKNKGHATIVRCVNCGRCIGKDKAIKRFQMRNIVDGSSKRDIKENYAFDEQHFFLPKIYVNGETKFGVISEVVEITTNECKRILTEPIGKPPFRVPEGFWEQRRTRLRRSPLEEDIRSTAKATPKAQRYPADLD